MNTEPTQDAHSLAIALRLAQAQIRDLRKANKQMLEALEKLESCDWVITLPDRMDAVRNIAKQALAAIKPAPPMSDK